MKMFRRFKMLNLLLIFSIFVSFQSIYPAKSSNVLKKHSGKIIIGALACAFLASIVWAFCEFAKSGDGKYYCVCGRGAGYDYDYQSGRMKRSRCTYCRRGSFKKRIAENIVDGFIDGAISGLFEGMFGVSDRRRSLQKEAL